MLIYYCHLFFHALWFTRIVYSNKMSEYVFFGAQLLVFVCIRLDLTCERFSLLNPLGVILNTPARDSLPQRRHSPDPVAVLVRPHIPTAYSAPDGWANTSGLGRCSLCLDVHTPFFFSFFLTKPSVTVLLLQLGHFRTL